MESNPRYDGRMALPRHLAQQLISLALVLQIVPVCGGLLIAETRSTTRPALMLVPMSSTARRTLAARAIDGHALLLGGGLLPGSLVVQPITATAPPFWQDGVLAIPVPPRLCGAGPTT